MPLKAPPPNTYASDVDFGQLADSHHEFRQYLKSNGQLDFSDPAAVQQLTRSLLERDFGLKLDLPDDRLCPPVPNRYNYILWIQGLVGTTAPELAGEYDTTREVVGLDIGTGASCIYPLLGCAARPKWKFLATEVDTKSMQYAKRNILQNDLKDRIRPVQSTPNGSLIPLDAAGLKNIDFTMCNPPFYSSASEMLESAATKSRPPYSACTGAEIEMVTAGGEIAFVKRMIAESEALQGRVQWYSSMLGKLSSVEPLVVELRHVGVKNWCVHEFVQGGKTRRWGLAWSWMGYRPPMVYARGVASVAKHILPFPSEHEFAIPLQKTDGAIGSLDETFAELDLRWKYRADIRQGVGSTTKNVWSRAARREWQQAQAKRQNADVSGDNGAEASVERDEPALMFRLGFERNPADSTTTVSIRWLFGFDSVLFESFCGMVRRTLLSAA